MSKKPSKMCTLKAATRKSFANLMQGKNYFQFSALARQRLRNKMDTATTGILDAITQNLCTRIKYQVVKIACAHYPNFH